MYIHMYISVRVWGLLGADVEDALEDSALFCGSQVQAHPREVNHLLGGQSIRHRVV